MFHVEREQQKPIHLTTHTIKISDSTIFKIPVKVPVLWRSEGCNSGYMCTLV